MPRVIWKGAISFGLVHVPVTLYPASKESGIDFDWLDARSMDPVGYKRINKRTGKEIDKDDIVKGLEAGADDYVTKPFDHGELRARVQVGSRESVLRGGGVRRDAAPS